MKKTAYFASIVGGIFAIIAGCRGSVDRVYDDAIATPSEGGLPDSTGPAGDGGQKEHLDGSADGEAPKTAPATIRAEVGGLLGTGLVLQNNGDDDLAIPANGSHPFPTKIAPGQPYKVTVANQPTGPSQTCKLSDGEGTAAGEDVKVHVDCVTATFPVGGTVVGLGAGKSVKLQNNGANEVTVTGDAPFSFPALGSGNPFNVTVSSNPPGATCTVSGGTGTVGTAPVDSVVVNCGANTYTVGGTVTGLVGTVVVTNNDGNDRPITSNGSFAFSLPIASGGNYDVKVKTQPAYPPQKQTCTVANGSGPVGAANITNVAITCTTNKYTVGGTVNGLTGAGLKLQNKGTDDKSVNAPGGAFTFSQQVPSGSTYNVTVVTQPAGQTCSVTNPSGTVASSTISSVVVNCSTPIALEEHFDTAQEPALPAGWTTETLYSTGGYNGAGEKFVTFHEDGDYASAPNAAFIENVGADRDAVLVSPAFTVASATAKLTFWNKYMTENGWDGAVLEINVAGAGWTDILAAGGSFNSGGYNATLISEGQASRLGGRSAWNARGQKSTSVNLPAAAAGKSVQLRWRFASDDGESDTGWWIDDVIVTN